MARLAPGRFGMINQSFSQKWEKYPCAYNFIDSSMKEIEQFNDTLLGRRRER